MEKSSEEGAAAELKKAVRTRRTRKSVVLIHPYDGLPSPSTKAPAVEVDGWKKALKKGLQLS